MSYEFQAVDLSVFDFHLMRDPLLNASAIQPQFNFLTGENGYNEQYQQGAAILTANLSVRPLNWRMLTYHHFWKYYQTIWPKDETYNFWKLQMPFICKLTNTQIKLVTGSPDFDGTVRSTVYLSAMGWSTNLDIHLRGKMKPAQLQAFVHQLPSKGASVFEVDGQRMPLPDVFKFIAQMVRQNIYGTKAIDSLGIMRHLIITLSQFTGGIAYYGAGPSGAKQMTAADRAMIHSIWRGATVSVPQVIKMENEKKFLLTKYYTGPDFALTDFDYGTLLFMQQTAGQEFGGGQSPRGKMRCHSSNIRNYLIMSLDLLSFYRGTKQNEAGNPVIKALREHIKSTLSDIPHRYRNPFCQAFHTKHGNLF
jgi:hypothetical protein